MKKNRKPRNHSTTSSSEPVGRARSCSQVYDDDSLRIANTRVVIRCRTVREPLRTGKRSIPGGDPTPPASGAVEHSGAHLRDKPSKIRTFRSMTRAELAHTLVHGKRCAHRCRLRMGTRTVMYRVPIQLLCARGSHGSNPLNSRRVLAGCLGANGIIAFVHSTSA